MTSVMQLSHVDVLVHALATCHSLVCKADTDADTDTIELPGPGPVLPHAPPADAQPTAPLVGDSMEVQLFEMTAWRLATGRAPSALQLPDVEYSVVRPPLPGAAAAAVGVTGMGVTGVAPVRPYPGRASTDHVDSFVILRDLPFSSALQRSAVLAGAVCGGARGPVFAFVKGAPEQIERLCVAPSLPADYAETVRRYTLAGYRVLAIAGVALPHVSWEQVGGLS